MSTPPGSPYPGQQPENQPPSPYQQPAYPPPQSPYQQSPYQPQSPYQQPPYQQSPYGGPQRKTSGMAITSLVFGILPCTWVVGLILGIVALNQPAVKSGQEGGRGMAIAAIVISAVWGVIGFLYGIYRVAGA